MNEPNRPDPGPRPELTWLPVDRLDVDPVYQRSLDSRSGKRLVQKIADNFRWAAFQAILASPAAAERWLIIDGQHRVAAAKQIGLALVPAVVIHGADRAAQAKAFVGANSDRVPVSAQALFYARLAAGESDAVTLKRLCDAAGVELLRYPLAMAKTPAGKTPAVSRLLVLLRRHGEEELGRVITIVGQCFGRVPGALRSIVFEAAARHIAGGGTYDELRRGLQRLGPAGIDRLTLGITTNSAIPLIVQRLTAGAPRAEIPLPGGASPEPAAAPLKIGPLPPKGGGFQDDPRAKGDHGSNAPLSREPIFGRSATGSSLA